MKIPRDVWIQHDASIPLASLGELEEIRQYENDVSVHDHEYDDCHDFKVNEE